MLMDASDASELDKCQVDAGGYFFGTFPSGKRVQDTIFKAKSWPQYKAPMLQLQALWKGQAAPFGCAYTCAIGDTVTQGVDAVWFFDLEGTLGGVTDFVKLASFLRHC